MHAVRHLSPEISKEDRGLQRVLGACRELLLDELGHAVDDELLVLLADEAVVENAERLVLPQPQELLRGGELLRRGQEKALERTGSEDNKGFKHARAGHPSGMAL